MKKLKIILLVWPVILLIGMYGYISNERKQIDEKLVEADGLIWEAGEKQFVVQVNQREDGELLHILITIVGPNNDTVYKTSEVIDRDMFGGGFVRAVQVDSDPEKEILVWHARAGFYLDFSKGQVSKISFDRVPQQVKDLARGWHKYNVMAGMTLTILLLFVFCYYTLYLIVIGILKLLKRKKR